MLLTKNFELVELIIEADAPANKPIYFQSQPQLQTVLGDKQVFIKAVETFSNQALTHSPYTAANPVAAVTDIQNATLTLNEAGTTNKMFIPLAVLNRIWNETPFTWQPMIFKDLWKVDWTKSYVTLVDTGPAAQFSYLFGVHYDYEPMIRAHQ